MPNGASQRTLTIEGIGRTGPIYSAEIRLGTLSEKGVIRILQRLAASHLQPAQIIAASLPQNATGYRPLLEARIDGARITVGVMPYYVATIAPGEEVGSPLPHQARVPLPRRWF
jgi:hypothetical protein